MNVDDYVWQRARFLKAPDDRALEGRLVWVRAERPVQRPMVGLTPDADGEVPVTPPRFTYRLNLCGPDGDLLSVRADRVELLPEFAREQDVAIEPLAAWRLSGSA